MNARPDLAPIANRKINERQLLSFEVGGTDTDLPKQTLTYSLGANAPAGATVNPTTGLFEWRPTEIQGGTTNRISIIIIDNGIPSLSATQTFTVIVRNSSPDFIVSLGSTNLLTGRSSSVPVRLRSGLELANISLRLPQVSGLTNLAMQAVASEVSGALFEPDGTNGTRVTIAAKDGQTLQGDLSLARLSFDAPAREHSSIVPLPIFNLRGIQANGVPLTEGRAEGGRVFVIGAEPLLDAILNTNGTRSLTLYGRPGFGYGVEQIGVFDLSASWEPIWQTRPDGTTTTDFDVSPAATNVFYRAYLVPGSDRYLKIRHEGASTVIEWPLTSGNCRVMEANSLTPLVLWTPVSGTPQTIGSQQRMTLPRNPGNRFYRLECN